MNRPVTTPGQRAAWAALTTSACPFCTAPTVAALGARLLPHQPDCPRLPSLDSGDRMPGTPTTEILRRSDSTTSRS